MISCAHDDEGVATVRYVWMHARGEKRAVRIILILLVIDWTGVPLVTRATCSVIIRSHHVSLAYDYELGEPKMSTGGRRGAEKLTLSAPLSNTKI